MGQRRKSVIKHKQSSILNMTRSELALCIIWEGGWLGNNLQPYTV